MAAHQSNQREKQIFERALDLESSDHASNPFLHTYHPDHDNLDNRDDTFQTQLSAGKESYDLRRVMTLM